MSDYSYSEIQNMQQRAMERVREMNRSSESALRMAQSELEPSKAERKAPVNPAPIKTKHTSLPPNFPKIQETRALPHEVREKQESSLLEGVLKEPDRALLMGLLMLLKSEGADEALMLALTYIMA